MHPAICPLCGSLTAACPAAHRRPFNHCPVCDLIHVAREAQLTPEQCAERYRLHRNSRMDPGYVAMLWETIAFLEKGAANLCRVLDYGCGPNPVLAELLQERGYRVTAYDPLFAPAADLSSPYDAVVAVEVFEHFTDPAMELRRIAALLREGGRLVARTLLHHGPNMFADWWYARDMTHVAFYSARTFAWIADAFNLQLISCSEDRLVLFERPAHRSAGL